MGIQIYLLGPLHIEALCFQTLLDRCFVSRDWSHQQVGDRLLTSRRAGRCPFSEDICVSVWDREVFCKVPRNPVHKDSPEFAGLSGINAQGETRSVIYVVPRTSLFPVRRLKTTPYNVAVTLLMFLEFRSFMYVHFSATKALIGVARRR